MRLAFWVVLTLVVLPDPAWAAGETCNSDSDCGSGCQTCNTTIHECEDNDSGCPNYCSGDMLYFNGTCSNDSCSYSSDDCSDQYYCSGNNLYVQDYHCDDGYDYCYSSPPAFVENCDNYDSDPYCWGDDVYYDDGYCDSLFESCWVSFYQKIQACGSDYYGPWSDNFCYDNDVVRRAVLHDVFCNSQTGTCDENLSTDEEVVQDCGVDSYGAWSGNYCTNGDVYQKRTFYDRGCASAACFTNTSEETQLIEDCGSRACVTDHCNNAPSAWLNSPSGGSYVHGTVQLQWAGQDPDGDTIHYYVYAKRTTEPTWTPFVENTTTTQFDWITNSFPDGLYQIRIIPTDGYTETWFESAEFTVDNTVPSCGSIEVTTSVHDATISWACTDVTSGIDHYVVCLDDAFHCDSLGAATTQHTKPGIQDGDHTFFLMAYDRAGNHISNPRGFSIGTNPPTVDVITPIDNQLVHEQVTVGWWGHDLDGDTLSYEVFLRSLTNPGWLLVASNLYIESWVWDTTQYQDDTYDIQVRAADGYGFFGDGEVYSVEVDNTPPQIAFDCIVAGEYYRQMVYLGFTASDLNGLSSSQPYEIRIDSVSAVQLDEFMWDTATRADGPHTISFIARDILGNEAVSQVTIQVDNTAPTITSIYETITCHDVTIGYAATDAGVGIGAFNCRVSLDNQYEDVQCNTPAVFFDIEYGHHSASIEACDDLGTCNTEFHEFDFANSPPHVEATTLTDGCTVQGAWTIGYSGTDPNCDPLEYEVYVDYEDIPLSGWLVQERIYKGTATSCVWHTEGIEGTPGMPGYLDGEYTVRIVASDGNKTYTQEIKRVQVDNHPSPQITVDVDPDTIPVGVNATFCLNCVGAVPCSDIISYEWTLSGSVPLGSGQQVSYVFSEADLGKRSAQARVRSRFGDWAERTAGFRVGRNPPVVCVPGIFDDHPEKTFSDIIERLEDDGFIAVPVLGMGSVFPGTSTDLIESNAIRLYKDIERTRDTYHVSEVDVVAHSMGGLITRCYIANCGSGWTYAGDIRRFVMVGTPNHGSLWCRTGARVGVGDKACEQMNPGSPFLTSLNAHGWDPNVDAIVVAGDCWFKWGDGFVSAQSASLEELGIPTYCVDAKHSSHWLNGCLCPNAMEERQHPGVYDLVRRMLHQAILHEELQSPAEESAQCQIRDRVQLTANPEIPTRGVAISLEAVVFSAPRPGSTFTVQVSVTRPDGSRESFYLQDHSTMTEVLFRGEYTNTVTAGLYYIEAWANGYDLGGDGEKSNVLEVWVDGAGDATVNIQSPALGDNVSGAVAVQGTVAGPVLHSYALEYTPIEGNSWVQIGQTGYVPVTNGTIETWDTASVQDGVYALRVSARDNSSTLINVATSTVLVQNNQLAVLSVTPSAGAGSVSTDSTISVTFNKPMDMWSVEHNLSIDPATNGQFSWEGQTVRFTPNGLLASDTTYHVTLLAGTRDAYDNQFGSDFSWSFSTISDCNHNGIPDSQDIATGQSLDTNGDNVPDECESIYDLDGDRWIGPGDISYIACCWLQPSSTLGCQGLGLCDASDFDCDGFVGVGDLSYWATGWLKCLPDPTIQYPPCHQSGVMGMNAPSFGPLAASGGSSPAPLSIALRAVLSPTGQDTVAVLPESVSSVPLGTEYYLEAWVTGTNHEGVTSAYVDVERTGAKLSIVSVSQGTLFAVFASGAISATGIDELGGSTLSAGVGTESTWARVAVAQLRAEASGVVTLALQPSASGCAVYGGGAVPWSGITLGSITVAQGTVIPPIEGDLDHDGDVDSDDLILFESCASGPGMHPAVGCEDRDLDRDNDVDQADFGILQASLLRLN